MTVAAPAECCDVVAVIVVALTKTTCWAGAPPKVTAAPAEKFPPMIVTVVPPNVVPLEGDTLPTRGAGSDGEVAEPLHEAKRERPHVHDPASSARRDPTAPFKDIGLPLYAAARCRGGLSFGQHAAIFSMVGPQRVRATA